MYRILVLVVMLAWLTAAIISPQPLFADHLCQATKLKVKKNSVKPPLKIAPVCPKGTKSLLDLSTLAGLGTQGPKGDPGVGVTDPLPSGKSIVGVIGGDFQQDDTNLGDWRVIASFPIAQSAVLGEQDVIIQNSEKVDNDCLSDSCLSDSELAKPAICSGSLANPTAPAGKVCIYPLSSINARSLRSYPVPLDANTATRGASVAWSVIGAGDTYFNAIWAYTAP